VKTFATLSATLSGNRGAEAMLRSMIENITDLMPGSKFKVLSVYPHSDVFENDYDNVEVIDARPKILLLKVFVQAFINKFVRSYPITKLCPASRAILKSDLLLDLSGVAFVDDRGLLLLIYNTLCVLIPVWFGVPVMKVSQAMGPFNNPLNFIAAKICLPQVSIICSRGNTTSLHLRQLGIHTYYFTADAAFSLPNRQDVSLRATEIVRAEKKEGKRVVGICPSVVVDNYCRENRIDYKIIMDKFIDHIIDQGFSVVLFPHSAREHTNKTKNNDLPLCVEINKLRVSKYNFHFIKEILNAFELRTLINECDLFVGSRFHSIISSLCVKTPFFLVGWSHKYVEVLDMFDISDMALDFKDLSVNRLCDKFDELVKREEEIVGKIEAKIEQIRLSSQGNARLAIDYVRDVV
jgi:polysaccharide pyruvyl transferase WcaK-like protein